MILVTGGTGFLGSHLLYALLQKGEKVRALKRDTSGLVCFTKVLSFYGKDANAFAGQIEWVVGDLSDIFSLLDALDGVTDVYHCAAKVSFNSSLKSLLIKTNVEGTANLVNACIEKGIRRLCHVSSIGALGSDEAGGLIDELTPRKASARHSAYSKSKYLAELEVWRGIAEGLEAVIVNPSVILGPGGDDNASDRLFRRVHKGLKYYTPGMNAYVDVRDVVKAMMLLMELPDSGERYVVSSENMGYKDILEMIAKKMGKEPPSKKAGKAMLTLAWALSLINGLFSRKSSPLTFDLIRILTNRSGYSSGKLIKKTGFAFLPVETTISDCCTGFLRHHPFK